MKDASMRSMFHRATSLSIHIFRWGVASVIGLQIFATQANAQSAADKYPDKPIKIVVPFAPGGTVDLLARVLGQKLTEKWGQPVIADSRPGASTMIGTAAVAKADPDGYTLLIVVSAHAINPALQEKMPYDSIKDFAPISLLARAPIVVYSNPNFPPKNLKEMVQYGKTNNISMPFGTIGPGSMAHLTGEMLRSLTGLNMVHIPYKGGTPAMNDVLANHIPMMFATLAQGYTLYQAGRVRALGVSTQTRYPSMPEVPTFVEQGFEVTTTDWYGLLAPAGTPEAIVTKLNVEIRRIMTLPDLGERLSSIDLVTSTPAELGALIRDETNKWGPFIRKLGIKTK